MLWSACSEEIQQQRAVIAALARADQDMAASRDSYKKGIESLVRSFLALSDAILAVPTTPNLLAGIYDGDVGECLGDAADTIEDLLATSLDSWDNDAEIARMFVEAAKTIAASMKHVQQTWPWRNELIVQRSLEEFDAGKGIDVRDIIDDLQS